MTKFSDGPAAGVVLSLRRAPLFLRVVQDGIDGQFDALDQLDDEPKPGETFTVYRCVENHGMVHLCGSRNGRRWGGWFAHATYCLHGTQPPIEVCVDVRKWQEWAKAEAANLKGDRCEKEST